MQSLKITQFSQNTNDSRMKLETDDKDEIEIQKLNFSHGLRKIK